MKLSRNFPLNALRVFDSAARHLSFTKAGEELGMTQTAVSYQIKLLEDFVGSALFERKPRQLRLTENGRRLAPRVTDGLTTLVEAVSDLKQSTGGTLFIHTTPTFAARWLSRHLVSFQIENPDLAVRLETSQDFVDFSGLNVDLAIRVGSGNWPGLKSHLLMRGGFSPMLSPSLADSIGGVKTPEDLLKLRIIDPTDPWWTLWFKAAGIDDPSFLQRTGSRMGAQTFEAAAAIAGQGVAILTPEFYTDEIALGRLIQPFDILSYDAANYWLVYPENRSRSRKIALFCDWIFSLVPQAK
ncbi:MULTISPECIES: LysR substrate-binding domain-containing protein [unclassified Rhizobium]|uniref:LysR substrate-binding domain-containing protein n=1 Tax=unclassified Rhizobium TaxID=2613769 RepID=UPI0017809AC1|nr:MULTISPECIES: LysR substrate-binding domain-containing protein [unclassified Rhizobium]MBD8686757.1 LysR family transcriptional regulator [Rhizobium sp. CFBP 13644]MBD8691440.1 LysR family transcriptional regulator [Rhizobium sp. CFBP 13717]